MLRILMGFFFVAIGSGISQPPYSGTIFDFPDSFLDTDPTTLTDVTYVGREQKSVFDRRSNYVTINAYIFSASFSDDSPSWEIIVNPEFSLEEATELAEKYSFNIGQMPNCIRAGVSGAVIHDGNNPWGGGDPLTIHHGQGLSYERQGIVTETMIHESTHAEFDRIYYNSAWSAAANADGEFISTYARDNPQREDHSESFLCWLVARYKRDRISDSDYNKITSTIPNRMKFYDDQNLELSPVGGATNLVFNNYQEEPSFKVYYNPVLSTIILGYELNEPSHISLQILDMNGRVIKSLANERVSSGSHQKVWNLGYDARQRVSGGRYIYRIVAGEFQATQLLVPTP